MIRSLPWGSILLDLPKLTGSLLVGTPSQCMVEQIPYEDLIRLPELFPFNIKVGLDYLRKSTPFSVYRAGGGINMVELSRSSST
jgi:hypothetical protein